jgi:DNA-binding CsgD family transcriptional regulator
MDSAPRNQQKYKDKIFHRYSGNKYGVEIKLTASQREEISRTTPGSSRKAIADKYGVSQGYVSNLRMQRKSQLKKFARYKSEPPTDQELSDQYEKDYYGDL